MSNIDDVELLRDKLLDVFDRLDKDLIDIQKASILAKTSETIMSSVKMQLAYSAMRDERPNVQFLQKCNKGLPSPDK